jgi:hypothetical protein
VKLLNRPAPGAEAVVDALAVARIVHLFQQDDAWPFFEIRNGFLGRVGDSRWADLASCPFCLSVWVAAAVAVARTVAPKPWTWLARVLAASYVTGKLESL